jgi:hypothetical protein
MAYNGQISPGKHGGLHVDQKLLSFLQSNTAGRTYLMAAPSSAQGSDYVIATGRPVFFLGGFSGFDPVLTPDGLARLTASGQLRYVYWDPPGPKLVGQQPKLATWLSRNCRVVPGFETNTVQAGALPVSLYDCAR